MGPRIERPAVANTRDSVEGRAVRSELVPEILETESDAELDTSHKEMLLRVLHMEQITVEDVMVQRNDIEAIDLEDDWDEVVEQLATSHHTRVPVFNGSLDNFVGIVHIRKMFYLSQLSDFNKETMLGMIREPYFIPENTSITHALTNLFFTARKL